MIWILGFLIIRNAYQSALYNYLQEQRLPSPYDTVEKVNRSDVIVNSAPDGFNIQLYQEAGLIEAWARRYAERIRVRNRLDKRHPKKLHIKKVLGAVIIAGMMAVLCIIVFSMELLASRFPVLECIIDYLTY